MQSENRVHTSYFEFFPVDDDADLMDESYRIRYRVYCEERHFLDPAPYAEGLEQDQFDPNSVHLLGRHRFLGTPAATARLVRASPLGFPIQRHCRFDRDHDHLSEPGGPGCEGYAEISRVAISKLFRQRIDDDPIWGGPPRARAMQGAGGAPPPVVNPEEAGSEILAGLNKCIYHQSKKLGVTHWLVAMERGLYVMLKRIGYLYRPIGPTVDYYGPVTPYIALVEDIERSLCIKHPRAFAYWMDGLEPQFRPPYELWQARG
jgi:N-acyl amino acid synthase of PEP-CTERM/exosortase system